MPGEGRLKSLGFSDSVINRIGKSRASSTRKHYKSQWDLFVTWSTEQKLNPLDASLPLLTNFIDYLFRVRNVSVRTILNYKSAIAFYWKSEVGYDVPENDTVVSDQYVVSRGTVPFHLRMCGMGHLSSVKLFLLWPLQTVGPVIR